MLNIKLNKIMNSNCKNHLKHYNNNKLLTKSYNNN